MPLENRPRFAAISFLALAGLAGANRADGAFNVSPDSLNFSLPQGNNSQTQTFSITPGSGSGTFTVNIGSNVPWANVSPGSVGFVCPPPSSPCNPPGSSVTVTVNSAGLSPGLYNGISLLNAGGSTQTVMIKLQVTAPGPGVTLSTNPSQVSVSLTAGTKAASAAIAVSGGPAVVQLSASGPGVSVDNSVINAPGSFTVLIDATSLSAGSYLGSVTLSCSSSTPCLAQIVPVSIQVTAGGLPAGDPFSLDASSVGFSTPSGKSPQPQQVNLSNTGPASLQIALTATSDQNWLSAFISPNPVPVGGTAIVTLSVDSSKLAGGDYIGTVLVSGGGAQKSITVGLSVTMAGPGDPLGLDTTSVGFSTAAGKSPPPQQVTLSNTTRTAVQIGLTVTSDQNWLSASINLNPVPAGGTAIVTLSVNSSKLAGGTYTGMIVLTGGGAQKTIAVGLVVMAPVSVGLSLPTLAFSVTTVGVSPSSQMFPVTNLTASSLAVAVTTSIVPNPHYRANWLSAAPAQFNLSPGGSQNITATVDSSMLGVGTYTGAITITADSYSQSIPVMITVSGGVNITVTPNRVDVTVSPGEKVRTLSFVITVDPGIASVIVAGSGPGVAGTSVRLNAPGSFSVAVDATNLGPGQANGVLTISCAGVPTCIPEVVAVAITVGASSTGPTIQAAKIASDFGGLKTLGAGTYIEIYGTNLAQQGVGRGLSASDFVNDKAPVILEGVSVKINGQAAYVYFVSPVQVNVLLPDGVPAGSVGLTLENSLGTSNSFQANAAPLQPTLLAPASFVIGGKQYLEALFSPLDPLTVALPVGALPGALSRPAKPGEILVFYGIGFGDVTPAVPIGLIAPSQSTTLKLPVQILFGQTAARVSYQGLVVGFVSLYQFNIEVPPLADSDAMPVTFTVGGMPGAQTAYIAIHQ